MGASIHGGGSKVGPIGARTAVADKAAPGKTPAADLEINLQHLKWVEQGRLLSCSEILEHYGVAAERALQRLEAELGVALHREWILAIIKQETGGVVRPRFEQHVLTRLNRNAPDVELAELRLRATSFGLGQVMGFNHAKAGAPSAAAMFRAPLDEQVLHLTRFIAARPRVPSKGNPGAADFRTFARYYNGPLYAKHRYHERIERWFWEFRRLA